MQSLEKHVNFENENSRKAYYREFKKVRCHLRHFRSWCRIKDFLAFLCGCTHTHNVFSMFVYGMLFYSQVIEASDVILEVLDARDPLGCRCPQVEQAVIQSGTNKKIVLVLNKIGKIK